jgi:hypothetical protein
MVPLTTAVNSFEARVMAARLGSAGILWELRGNVDGPYPVGAVLVLVAAEDEPVARELLLVDEVEAAFDGEALDEVVGERPTAAAWFVLASLIAMVLFSIGRLLGAG